jgi:hypothetical protein
VTITPSRLSFYFQHDDLEYVQSSCIIDNMKILPNLFTGDAEPEGGGGGGSR